MTQELPPQDADMPLVSDDESIDPFTARYPPADITAAEFEEFVAELLEAAGPKVDNLKVTLHDKIQGLDGDYDFDATVRYEFMGMSFLVLVEAKMHKNPIKRELVQVLFQKVQSVGGHKGVMFSTAQYQSGAISFAKRRGIALALMTEGRFTYETKSRVKPPPPTREQAWEWFGIPTFVAHHLGPTDSDMDSTTITVMSTEYPDYVAELLLAVPPRSREH